MKEIFSGVCAAGFIIILISLAEGDRGYSYADCTYAKPDYASTYYGGRCFCYTSPAIKWKDYWSTFQVQVSSKENVLIEYPMELRGCHDTKNLLKLVTCAMEHYWPSRVQKEQAVDIPLVEEEVFFMVRSPRASAEYTLHVSKQRFNRMRFFLFISGLTLFFFAGAICRSSLFFYISGVSLGIISIFVFLLLVLKKFIPSRGLFLLLFGASSSLSYLALQKLINERDEIVTLYWRELLGYVLVSGVVSLALCYRLGPVTSRRTLGVTAWALQAVGVLVACHGLTYAPVSWILLAVLLSFMTLPLVFTLTLLVWRQTCWLLSTILNLFQRRRSSQCRLLTEEEYREQAEKHTRSSLEELRRHCSNPGFPAWDTVLRLRTPHGFAEFLRSGAHVTPAELLSHEQSYGFGAQRDENTALDSTHTTATSEDFSDDENHSSTHQPPNQGPFFSPPSLSTLCSLLPALPSPPAYTASICPYPPTPYPPPPERPLTEDDEEPF